MARWGTLMRRWYRRDGGIAAVELVLITPMMIWAVLATIVYFDAYRVNAQSLRAGQTVADTISREMTPIDPAYLSNSHTFLGSLIDTPNPNASLRVTLYTYDLAARTYHVVWSQGRGALSALNDGTLAARQSQLPLMADDGRALLVETAINYAPPFRIGIGPFASTDLDPVTLTTFIVTQPRFLPSVCLILDPSDADSVPIC